MPCYQVVTNTVAFETAQGHEDLLEAALKEAGYTTSRYGNAISFSGNGVSGSYNYGRFSTQGDRFDVDQVKRNFSGQVIKHASKKFGWSLKSTGANKFEIHKRL